MRPRSVQNYETADSGLISRGRTYETLTLAGAGVAQENLSLVDEAWHLSVDSSKAITSPVCLMMGPSILTPLRAEFGLAVYPVESAALLGWPSDLAPEALRSAGFQHEGCSQGNDNGSVFVKVLSQ